MNPAVPVGPNTHKALQFLGGMSAEVMNADTDGEFWVSTVRQQDGSLLLKVLHSRGSSEFVIPREERASEVGRESAPESKGNAH